ncbi:HPr family phosphocarrier protein [Salipaludibacillus sp. CUR1]|jgi:phosphocarrier protein HPr|uniref:Phosphocarrier protein n=1 Tax=Salipaludibacillus aurantiacus TaxID=1601833 RepID=A0A1H9RHE9_9BACI|nr:MULTISPECIES: HPr family phosphocarrier protein [Salipaludibacillus]MCE7790908.1 HPr family phosphocarrier protein [Salipaludibacillus sp. CUR1]SER72231.1 phosphocarrier protein [Salipaludibacillus aurantiacus]
MKLTVKKPIFAESASYFVNRASQISGTVLIKKEHWVIDAKSLLGILALSLQPGQEIELEFEGEPDEQFIQDLEQAGLFEK